MNLNGGFDDRDDFNEMARRHKALEDKNKLLESENKLLREALEKFMMAVRSEASLIDAIEYAQSALKGESLEK